jgi:hypothetical protein
MTFDKVIFDKVIFDEVIFDEVINPHCNSFARRIYRLFF